MLCSNSITAFVDANALSATFSVAAIQFIFKSIAVKASNPLSNALIEV